MSDPSAEIDAKIAAIGDRRRPVFARMRQLIREADPDVVDPHSKPT